MRRIIRILLVVLAAIIILVTAPTAWAEDATVTTKTVEGEIIGAYKELSIIVIEARITGESVTIVGFPFNNLEAQLGEFITIEEGNCVTVEYSEKYLCSGEFVNKWESLMEYCKTCPVNLDQLTKLSCNDVGDLSLKREPQQNKKPD